VSFGPSPRGIVIQSVRDTQTAVSFRHILQEMSDTSTRVLATILAAGHSTRFGSTKQTSQLDGTPLVRRAVNVAMEVCDGRTIIIAGHDWLKVIAAARTDGGFFVINEQHADGMGSSIAMAVRTCRSRADAMLLLLCDQPLINAQHLRTLIEKWSGDEQEIVATSFAETTGPPVLFPRGVFADLLNLKGDYGARDLLHDSRFKLISVPFDDAAVDIDTLKDLDVLQGTVASRQ